MAILSGKARLHLTSEPTDRFIEQLEGQLQAPVRDETGLRGRYDFDLYWDVPGPAGDSDSGPDLIQAVKEQLGLSLAARKITIDCLVLDDARRIPEEN
jgi:uncharacterized protein (TIGR03435 family)